jgi:purine-binding chemotaxis protein CheW
MDVLIFEVEGVRYGLSLALVREVVRAVAVTPLPRAPAVVNGIIDVRGETLPVFDLRRRFGAAERPVQAEDRFVIARGEKRTAALRVDRVHWTHRVDEGQIEKPSELVPRVQYVAGIVKLPDGMVLIHDLDTFLSASESLELEAELEALKHGAAG